MTSTTSDREIGQFIHVGIGNIKIDSRFNCVFIEQTNETNKFELMFSNETLFQTQFTARQFSC